MLVHKSFLYISVLVIY